MNVPSAVAEYRQRVDKHFTSIRQIEHVQKTHKLMAKQLARAHAVEGIPVMIAGNAGGKYTPASILPAQAMRSRGLA